jgi:hypothetical protein
MELIVKYREMGQSRAALTAKCQVALIEVMSDSREWFISATAVLLLEGNRVHQAYAGSSEKSFALLTSTASGE